MIADITLLASSSDGDIGGFAMFLFAAGPAAGLAVWFWIHAKYRNRNARYEPERVVHHTVQNLAQEDVKTKHFQTSASSLEGSNETNSHVRASVTRVMKVEGPPPPPPE